jgi:hypothetical protein
VIFDDEGYPRLETDCPWYDTVTADDVSLAISVMNDERRRISQETTEWTTKHSRDELLRQYERFEQDLTAFNKNATGMCLWIDANEYLRAKQQ